MTIRTAQRQVTRQRILDAVLDLVAEGELTEVTVPDVVVKHVQSTTLACSANGQALAPETLSTVGEHFVKRDVPPAALSAEAATFDCSLSKFIASGALEERELGVIATSASLESK